VCKFLQHQRIDKPQKSKLSELFQSTKIKKTNATDEFQEPSKNNQGTIQEPSTTGQRLEQGTGNGTGNGTVEQGNGIFSAVAGEHEAIVQYWNQVMGKNCRLTDARKKVIRTRLKDNFWQENWRVAIDKCHESRFCMGQGNKGWIADLDWFLSPEIVTRLIEGKYSDQGNGVAW
jgi:uncharacterized phage protein (TIGR02220 family)